MKSWPFPHCCKFFLLCYFIDGWVITVKHILPRGAPVRQAQMIQLPCLQTASFFFFPFLFPLFHTLCLFWEHSNLLLSCTFSSSSPPPPLLTPSPLLRAGGWGAITHHLVITGTKGALVAPGCGLLAVHRHWGESGGKSPASTSSLHSSIIPTSSDDENSVSAD